MLIESKEVMMVETPQTGRHPDTVGKCTECGKSYPVRKLSDGTLEVVGTEGGCLCGNDEFTATGG